MCVSVLPSPGEHLPSPGLRCLCTPRVLIARFLDEGSYLLVPTALRTPLSSAGPTECNFLTAPTSAPSKMGFAAVEHASERQGGEETTSDTCRRGALIALLWRFRMPLEVECLSVSPFLLLLLWLLFGLCALTTAAFLYCFRFALHPFCVVLAPFFLLISGFSD